MESLICQGEASWYGEMLSITGMKRIVSAWDRIGRLVDKEQLDTARLELLFAATLGGMAISNIRTGHIHEAAGALLEYTRLTHAETLFVFMQSACEDYSPNLDSRLAPLWQEFSALSAGLQFRSLTEVAGWWHHQFERVDALSQITCEVSRVCASAVVRQALFDRIWADRVWVEKESPIPLTADFISSFIDRSLSRFAKAGVVP
jgi:alcohol dehydrogenase class IV